MLIQHDFDTIINNNPLINQLFATQLLTIATYNIQIISDTTKYSQLLKTLILYKVDFYSITEIGYNKG